MELGQGFSDLIYDYLVLRFRFQYYKSGERLPAIDALCSQFGVSSLTIKAALKRLQREGYISMRSGRCSTVLFRQSGGELDAFAIRFFSERRVAIPDLYQSSELVVTPMLIKGFQRMDQRDFTVLEQLAEQSNPEALLRFYCYILQKAENPLVINLFWENTLFLGLPFPMQDRGHTLYHPELSRQRLKTLLACGKTGDAEQIREAHRAFQRDVSYEIIHYIGKRLPEIPEERQVSFSWRVYRDRPQICCSLAVHVIHDVYMGEYRNIEFLPSLKKMAEKYGVSISTMRRTVRLLSQLGAIRPINGKGIQILLLHASAKEEEPDLSVPLIRSNMAYFIQSFELLAESCEGVMGTVLQALSQKEKDDLADLLEGLLNTGRCAISLQSVYAFIAEHSPLQGIREMYGKLYSLNLWGYPLKSTREKMPDIDRTPAWFTKTLLHCLKMNDVNLFAKSMAAFVQKEYLFARKLLLARGFTKADLSRSSSFSLLRPEKT